MMLPRHRIPADAAPPMWRRYVALGDSFTEGMCDEDPDTPDVYRGWADRLADHLAALMPGLEYANLAVRGRLLADIVGPQLEAALELRPDLVTIVGGGNDCLRPGAHPERLAERLELAVSRLRGSGADVMLAVPVDPRDSPFVRHTRGVVAAYSMHIWDIAGRYDCYLMDLWGFAALRDWRMWAPDRIHLTSEAHRRVAHLALASLGLAGGPGEASDWHTPLAPAARPSRREAFAGDVAWFKEYAGPWVHRRLTGRSSGDGRVAKRPMPRAVTDQSDAVDVT